MTTGVMAVRGGIPCWEIAALLRQHRISGVPVVDDDGKVVGVVSETDLLAEQAGSARLPHRAAVKAAGATAADLMTRPAVTTGPDELAARAARLMYSRKLQRLPVVDRDGRLVGIVSRADVLKVFHRTDEQIRREVTQDVIADQVRHLEGVVAVRDRFTFPQADPD